MLASPEFVCAMHPQSNGSGSATRCLYCPINSFEVSNFSNEK